MTTIEIELKSPNAPDDIYELRKYLQENIEGFQIDLKEQPPLQGQMAIGILEPILICLAKDIAGRSFEVMYNDFLKPWIAKWKANRKGSNVSTLEVVTTMKDENSRLHIVEDAQGKTKMFDNLHFAINTDRTIAILIGVGAFDSDFLPIPPVKGNLEDFAQLLKDKSHIGLLPQNIVIVFNETSKEILKQLHKASRTENIDTIIIYFAGHGYRSDVDKLYFIAKDSEKVGDEIINGVDLDFIKDKILKNSVIKQKIMVIDACHSGIAAQGEDDLISNIDVSGTYILASSQGDKVSYFDNNERNTYFTGTLIDVLRNGTNGYNEMLSLHDIYEVSSKSLTDKKLPRPLDSNKLNIDPSSFFIAHNPSFSIEKLKGRADKMYKDGHMEMALQEYDQLSKRFPEDFELLKKYRKCQNEFTVKQSLDKANTLFYKQNDYAGALEFYLKAYELNKDPYLLNLINECRNKISSEAIAHKANPTQLLQPQQPQPATEKKREASRQTQESTPAPQYTYDKPEQKPKPGLFNSILKLLGWIFLLIIIYAIVNW